MNDSLQPVRRRLLAAMGAVLLSAVGSGCDRRRIDNGDPPATRSGEGMVNLAISGSSTMGPLLDSVARNFEALYPNVRVTIDTGGTLLGIENVRRGVSAIGMASRNLADGEQDLQSFPIARDGVGIVVSASNSVQDLSSDQLRSIYTDQINSWHSVGGAEAPITVVSREKGRSILELLLQYLDLPESALRPDRVAGENSAAFDAALADANAMTLMSVGESARNIAAGMPLKLLDIDGTPASIAMLANGSYPVLRPLTLITRAAPEGTVKQFIDFCLSSQATEHVRHFDFIPYLD